MRTGVTSTVLDVDPEGRRNLPRSRRSTVAAVTPKI